MKAFHSDEASSQEQDHKEEAEKRVPSEKERELRSEEITPERITPERITKERITKEKIVSAYTFLSVGFEFLAIFLFCCGIGWLGDIYLGSGRPFIGLLIGLFTGFAASSWHLYRRVQELQNSSLYQSQKSSGQKRESNEGEQEKDKIRRIRKGINKVHQQIKAVVERQELKEREAKKEPQKEKELEGEAERRKS